MKKTTTVVQEKNIYNIDRFLKNNKNKENFGYRRYIA